MVQNCADALWAAGQSRGTTKLYALAAQTLASCLGPREYACSLDLLVGIGKGSA